MELRRNIFFSPFDENAFDYMNEIEIFDTAPTARIALASRISEQVVAKYFAAINIYERPFQDTVLDLFQGIKNGYSFAGSIIAAYFREETGKGYFLFQFSVPLIIENNQEFPFMSNKFRLLTESEFKEILATEKWEKHPVPMCSNADFEKNDTLAISIEKILCDVDKRTTCMIRNIPNKYNQQMLLDLVNETHYGLYDFFYLRIDFKNKCNVGYAFINFVEPRHIFGFYEKFCGKKWTRFNSEKICSLSYAKIQGRDNLIQKFRNSSVMNENPAYRPKIFFTHGILAGLEEPFPVNNNEHYSANSTQNLIKAMESSTLNSPLSPERRIIAKPNRV